MNSKRSARKSSAVAPRVPVRPSLAMGALCVTLEALALSSRREVRATYERRSVSFASNRNSSRVEVDRFVGRPSVLEDLHATTVRDS